jgi:hypothetical protein
MPGTFSSISIFAYDLDGRGNLVQSWETAVDGTEAEAIAEAKGAASRHAGALVARRDGNPTVGEEGEPSSSSAWARRATSTDAHAYERSMS